MHNIFVCAVFVTEALETEHTFVTSINLVAYYIRAAVAVKKIFAGRDTSSCWQCKASDPAVEPTFRHCGGQAVSS